MSKETEQVGGARILIVDDDPHTRDILDRWLTREGLGTAVAAGGTACVETLTRDSDFDVIVLDVMMPGMDGLQVCMRLREHPVWRGIPVILLTAKDDIETRAQGMTLGVSEYLTKPVSRKELLGRVRAQVHSRSLQRSLERTEAAIIPGGAE